MNADEQVELERMWDSVCPAEFRSIAPFTLFTATTLFTTTSSSKRIYPDLVLHTNPTINVFTQVARENVESPLFKRRTPAPRERFATVEKYEPRIRRSADRVYIELLQRVLRSMVGSKDKFVCAKQTPTYTIRESDVARFMEKGRWKTLGMSGLHDGNRPYTVWHGGHIVLLSKKGYIFTFTIHAVKDTLNTKLQSSLRIDIYDMRNTGKTLHQGFVDNVVNVFLDHIIYNTPDFEYTKMPHSLGIPNVRPPYMNFFAQQFRFEEDIVDTLIVLVYAQLYDASQQQQQKQTAQVQKQQSYFQKQEKRIRTQLQQKFKNLSVELESKHNKRVSQLEELHRQKQRVLRAKERHVDSLIQQLSSTRGLTQKYLTAQQFTRDTRTIPHRRVSLNDTGVATLYDLFMRMFPSHDGASTFKVYHGTENVSRRGIKSQGIRIEKNVTSAHGRGFYVSPLPSVAYHYACSRYNMRSGCSNRAIFEFTVSPEASKQVAINTDFAYAQNGDYIVLKTEKAIRLLQNKTIYIIE